MKYEVKMSCGHTETIQLFGKCADRERKIEWLERYGLCEECKKEQAAKEIKKAEEAGLPELEGSEKQIAWAAKIRNGFLPKAKEALERAKHLSPKNGTIGLLARQMLHIGLISEMILSAKL